MRPAPDGWPRITPTLFYDDASAAIDWLVRAFGLAVRLKVAAPGGRIAHSELTLGDGVIMVGEAGGKSGRTVPVPARSPRSLGGCITQALAVFVDDVDAHCAHARANGAVILEEPATHDYGADYWSDRVYRAADIEGHQWWFMQRVREGKSL